ncbi:hypothetical protein ACIP5Y_43870 [Nocardia sp. NPDC088792]|uniref:hypothetical protein n=1 Tax=Nocardia sp. NPDC088792 TaxID=3364332 RepID=UPI003804A1A1
MGSAVEARQRQLAELRKRIAAVPARGAGAHDRAPVAAEKRREALPVPPALEGLLPDGGLAKGSVVAYRGASSLLAGLLASVTAAGGHAAVVGLPRLGLLAAAEMGARLDRLAVVAEPGDDPLEIASVLLDGLDLVVLDLGGASIPMSRTRILTAKARSKNATLVVTGGAWAGPVLRIDTRVTGYSGLGRGCGRLRGVRLNVSVHGRSAQPRTGHLAMSPCNGRVEWVDTEPAVVQPLTAEPLPINRHAAS